MIKDIVLGITAYFRYIPLIGKGRLGKYFLAPLLVGIVLIATIGSTAYGLSDNLGDWLSGWYKWERGSALINSASAWFGGIIIFVLGLILAKYMVLILASPFMSPMSQKIEVHTQLKPNLPSSGLSPIQGVLRGLRIASGNIIKELFFTVILLVLSLVLPFLSPFTAVLIFIIQAYYAGCGNMDYTLERYFGVKESKQFIRAHRGLAIGNGAVFVAMLMLGFGFFVAPPLSTLAATPEVLKRLNNFE